MSENLKNWQLRVSPGERKNEKLAIRGKSRWKNENLESWQSKVSPDMWMKNGELADNGKSIPKKKDKKPI